MLEIFAPENDKKRLVALLVILAIVMVISLVYKYYVLTPEEVVVVENSNLEGTQKISDKNLPGIPVQTNSSTTGVVQGQKIPPPPTDEDVKKMQGNIYHDSKVAPALTEEELKVITDKAAKLLTAPKPDSLPQ